MKNILLGIIALAVIIGVFYVFRGEQVASVQVLAPRSGDVIDTGSTQTITWSTKHIPASDKISIAIRRIPPPALPEEGQEFDPIIFIDLPNTGSKKWLVSHMYPDGTYVIGVTSYASVPVTNPISAESAPFRIHNTGAVASVECHDSPKYYAIQKSLAPQVGSDILVKYKENASQDVPCAYVVEGNDFEIKNVEAEYFLAFTDNFLVLDKGTAPPPRGLVVYDLRSRKKVFTDTYAQPVTVQGDTLTYFSKTTRKPTLQNCAQLNEYTKNGLGAVILSKVRVDLLSLNKKELGEYTCTATQ